MQSYSGDDSNRNVLKSIKHISGINLVAMTINTNCPIYFFALKILNLIKILNGKCNLKHLEQFYNKIEGKINS